MSASDLIAVVAIVALASMVQGISGFGFALVSMPLLSAVIGVERALAVQTILGIVANGTTAWSARTYILRSTAIRIALASFAGMPLGWFVLEHVGAKTLKLVVGCTVGTVAVLLASRFRIKATGPAVDVMSGFISGILATSTGTNGPPLVIALSARQLPSSQQRATLSTVFAVANIVVLVLLIRSGRVTAGVGRAVLAALPLQMFLWSFGNRVFAQLDQRRYDVVVIALLFTSAAVAMISAALA